MIKKIISGGQVGADQAALDVAIKMGIPHGGWIQKGRKTQSGILPEKYRLKEMPTASFKERIEQNVKDSDGTLIISHGKPTGSSDYNRKMALKYKRHLLHIDPSQINTRRSAELINSWIALHHVEKLNVAGSRASEDPKIYKATMDILEKAYYLDTKQYKSIAFEPIQKAEPNEKSPCPSTCPKTIDEAVDQIISEMQLRKRITIAKLKKVELKSLNFTLGISIRNQYLRKDDNRELLKSCREVAGKKDISESMATFVIIEKLWEKLRSTHRLRVVI